MFLIIIVNLPCEYPKILQDSKKTRAATLVFLLPKFHQISILSIKKPKYKNQANFKKVIGSKTHLKKATKPYSTKVHHYNNPRDIYPLFIKLRKNGNFLPFLPPFNPPTGGNGPSKKLQQVAIFCWVFIIQF